MKNPSQFITDLRKLGFKVDVQHERMVSLYDVNRVLPRGGITYVRITDGGHKYMVTGVARCSRQDNYNKRIGLAIALGRAWKQMSWAISDPVHNYVLPSYVPPATVAEGRPA